MKTICLNNKGLAISGMLYTLFALFLIIMFSILAMSNFKRNVLMKTTKNLEESYTLKKITDANNYIDITTSTTKITGKYVFKTKIAGMDKTCIAYLKRGTSIPNNINAANFSLIPEDCNDYNSTIKINNQTEEPTENNMILTEVYVFRKNEKESG